MKMVTAIIRPEKFDSVKAALEREGIYGMTISEARGRGGAEGYHPVVPREGDAGRPHPQHEAGDGPSGVRMSTG